MGVFLVFVIVFIVEDVFVVVIVGGSSIIF